MRPSPRSILRRYADLYGVEVEEILDKRRFKQVVAARHDTIKALRYELGWSLLHIGYYMNMHHASVLHALNKERKNEDTRSHGDF